MARVKGKNTRPERLVRSILHRLGYRFRLHRADLPGRPDVVLPRHSKIVVVNGCFWHGHRGCKRATRPVTRATFWDAKIAATIARDRRNLRALTRAGWHVLPLWECQTRDLDALTRILANFMATPHPSHTPGHPTSTHD